MPRSTTQVPTTEVVTTMSKPANRALRMDAESTNGSIHHVQGSVTKSTVFSSRERRRCAARW